MLFRRRLDRNIRPAAGFFPEFHGAAFLGEQRVVGAHANAFTREPGGAALTADDVARDGRLAAEQLHAQTTPCGVATVAG